MVAELGPQSGVQRPLPFPSEAEFFKLFLTEDQVGDSGDDQSLGLGATGEEKSRFEGEAC